MPSTSWNFKSKDTLPSKEEWFSVYCHINANPILAGQLTCPNNNESQWVIKNACTMKGKDNQNGSSNSNLRILAMLALGAQSAAYMSPHEPATTIITSHNLHQLKFP